ncbi:four-carbon acid sugar kinase family protein, partial [Varibaculum cambriense]
GHFPLEPQTIMDEMEKTGTAPADAIILVPAFGDAGRITVNGIHYAGSEQEGFIPVGETEFAKDATFGYHESSLPSWVAEKTAGKVKAEEVEILKLQDLRENLANVSQQLEQAQNGQVLVADTVTEEDLRQLALALIKAEAKGKNFVYRVGPPFVRARIGQEVHPPLTREEIATARGERELAAGGLIVVGSHVELTTRQLNRLRVEEKPAELEIEVQQIIDPERRDKHLKDVTDQAISAIKNGNVIVRTSRKLVTGVDGDASLEISRQVSAAVVKVTKEILKAAPPRFVVAKGGITSSDTASKGLEIRRAMVIGPMLEGIVSLWTASSGPATGIPYVVFAGNVGNEESLTQVVRKLSRS